MITYSDGEGSEAGVGVGIWARSLAHPQAGYMQIPPCIRDLWRCQRCSRGERHDIFEIEAIGPLIALCTWPGVIAGALWMHFIDNDAALSVMVRGSGTVHSADIIAGMVWDRVAFLQCRPWFERVESAANPVDGLSRGKLDGAWSLIELTLLEDLHDKLRDAQSL